MDIEDYKIEHITEGGAEAKTPPCCLKFLACFQAHSKIFSSHPHPNWKNWLAQKLNIAKFIKHVLTTCKLLNHNGVL